MRSIPIPQIKKAMLKVRECPGDNSASFGVGVTPALMLDGCVEEEELRQSGRVGNLDTAGASLPDHNVGEWESGRNGTQSGRQAGRQSKPNRTRVCSK